MTPACQLICLALCLLLALLFFVEVDTFNLICLEQSTCLRYLCYNLNVTNFQLDLISSNGYSNTDTSSNTSEDLEKNGSNDPKGKMVRSLNNRYL
jgi:hypothetical protein